MGRPFEKPAVVVGVMPTAERVLVQLSRRHTRKRTYTCVLEYGAWVEIPPIYRRVRVVWYGMVEVCEGAPVAVSGWVLADRHDRRPCAASSLHRGTISVGSPCVRVSFLQTCRFFFHFFSQIKLMVGPAS